MSKTIITWKDIDAVSIKVANKIKQDNININCLIGLSRGGLVPATILAHQLGVREILVHGYHSYDDKHNIRDYENRHGVMYQDVVYDLRKSLLGRNILIVDDLCDEGVTMKGLLERLKKKFHEGAVNIRTAVLYRKAHSIYKPNYIGKDDLDNSWIEFPWEASTE